MKLKLSIIVAALALVPVFSYAQNAPEGVVVVEKGKGAVRKTGKVVVQGAITAIDEATRNVTIMGGGGNEVSMVAGPEVKNFAQLKVGDIVTMTMVRSLAMELKKDGKALRSRVENSGAAQAKPGEKPGAGEARSVQVVADVVAVDKKKGLLTLKGPERTVELAVEDKTMLKDVAVGDQIEATYIEAVAISVSAPKKAK